MAEKVPIRAIYSGSDTCGLSELRVGEVVGVEHGGLGACTLTTNGILLGNTQGAVQVSSALTTNGQLLIGGTSGPAVANITGTANEVDITNGDGTIAIGLPATVCVTTKVISPALCIASQYVLPSADGSAGQVMCTDGSGGIAFATNTPSSPGGSDTYVQFNDGSSFGGSANFTWDDTTVKASNFCTAGTATLATVDINAGAIDGTIIGAASAAAITGAAIVGSSLCSTGNIIAAGTVEPAGDTAASDNAAIGYTATEGIIITGQGSTNDVTIKNDADTTVLSIPTGATGAAFAGTLSAVSITDTGTTTIATADINGGAIDGTTIGAASAAAITATTITGSGNISFDGGTFIFNESGADKDFRIEGDTAANLFITDASVDRIGIGTATPSHLLDIEGVGHAATCFVSADLCATTKVVAAAICMGGGYALPTSDGTAGYILCTDGSGAVSFAAAASSGHTIAEDGSTLADRTCLNFCGSAVTVTDCSATNSTDVKVDATGACMPIRVSAGTQCYACLATATIAAPCLQCDSGPKLGGNLDVNSNSIISASNGNIPITPNGSGIVIIDGLCHPIADGSAGQLLCTDGSAALKFATATAGVTLAGSTNNTIATVTGANALAGEANLTFDGTTLAVTGALTMANAAGPTIVNEAATATNPTLIPNKAEVDTGYGWAAADTLTVVTGGTERMRIDSAGLVGIGTAAPGNTLHVYGSGNIAKLQGSSGTEASMAFTPASGNAWQVGAGPLTANSFQLYENTAGAARITVLEGGNVGIGVTAPTDKLQVNFDAASQTCGITVLNTRTDGNGSAVRFNSCYCSGIRIHSAINGNADGLGGALSFHTTADNATLTRHMIIKPDGKVGIGTSAPDHIFHVQDVGANSFNTKAVFDLENTRRSGYTQAALELAPASSGGAFRTRAIAAELIGDQSATDLVFYSESTEHMRIHSDGDVDIGATGGTNRLGAYDAQNQTTFQATNSLASFTGTVMMGDAHRAATANYNLGSWRSSAGADIEFKLRGDGQAYADGSWNASGADYQEWFESADGTEYEIGKAVVLDGDKVRVFNADTDSADNIMGITRPQADNKNSAVVGNTAWNHWTDKYLTDDWGVYLRDDVTVWEWDEVKYAEGDELPDDKAVGDVKIEAGSCYERDEEADWTPPAGAVSSTQSVRKLNPEYSVEVDDETNYTPRADRAEWNLIGMLGQVQIKANEPTNPRWIKMKNISDAVELWMIR